MRETLIALPLDRVESTDHRLSVAIGIGAVVVLATLAAATWWLLRLGLRPIAEVTEVADAIARGDRSRRMREGGGETEAAHLAHAFNVMLDEQQGQEDQLRQFVADASHELRTPVAAIGGFVDLWRQGAISDDEVGEVMRRIGQESVRMRDLVEDLLLLARLDEGRPLASDPVDLTALANDAALDASATHPSRPVAVQSPGPVIITGDEPRLRQLLGNLVNNALVHTDMNTHVTVRVEPVGDRVILSVLDDGPGMTPRRGEPRLRSLLARGRSSPADWNRPRPRDRPPARRGPRRPRDARHHTRRRHDGPDRPSGGGSDRSQHRDTGSDTASPPRSLSDAESRVLLNRVSHDGILLECCRVPDLARA